MKTKRPARITHLELAEVSVVSQGSNKNANIIKTTGKSGAYYTISDDTVDSHNTRIDNATMRMRPKIAMYWSHKTDDLPIGLVPYTEKRIINGVMTTQGKGDFDVGKDDKAKMVFHKVQRGELNMVSGGFRMTKDTEITVEK